MKNRFLLIGIALLLIAAAGFGVWFFFGKKTLPPFPATSTQTSSTVSVNGQGQAAPVVSSEERAKRYVSLSQGVEHPLNIPVDMVAMGTDMNDPIMSAAFTYRPYRGENSYAASSASPPVNTPTATSQTGGYNGSQDTDGDGLTNDQELKLGTNPKNGDTDRDGLTDGEEALTYHTNPLNADTDNDGLTDAQEIRTYKTDPLKSDTDGDGFPDGEEVRSGYNPNGPGKLPSKS